MKMKYTLKNAAGSNLAGLLSSPIGTSSSSKSLFMYLLYLALSKSSKYVVSVA